jgi:uncharacterized membrane protein required for colicin V production
MIHALTILVVAAGMVGTVLGFEHLVAPAIIGLCGAYVAARLSERYGQWSDADGTEME